MHRARLKVASVHMKAYQVTDHDGHEASEDKTLLRDMGRGEGRKREN